MARARIRAGENHANFPRRFYLPISSTPMKPTILATTIALLLAPSLFAVIESWDGGGANDNLNTALNWLDNTAPLSDLVNTDLIFAGTTRLTPNVSVALSTNSVAFNNTAGAFTINGTVLSVGTGGITNNDANTQTFNSSINFGLVATATVNAASGALTFINQITAPIDLTVDGAFATTFFNIQAGGSILKQGAGTMSWGSTVATDVDVTVSVGTMTMSGATTFNSGSVIAVNGTSDLNIDQNVTFNGGQFTRATGATLAVAAGKTLTVQNGADAILTGSFSNTTASTIAVTGVGSTFSTASTLSFLGGSTLTVAAGGDVSSGTGSISIGASGGNGTVSVDGGGSSFGGGNLNVGLVGSTGLLTFSNGSTGAFGSIGVDNSATAATGGTLNIQSGATVTGTSLFLAPSAASNSGTVTITGAASALTISGAGAITIGATSASTAALNVQSGGTFNSGTGTTTVNTTGTVAIAGGTFNQNGNMILSGLMTRDATGVFNLAAGRTLTVQGGGDFTNSGTYSHTTASTVTVTGAGSTLSATASNQLRFSGGSTLNVLAGAQATAGGSILLGGDPGNATGLVDGPGSVLTSVNFGLSLAASSGSVAALTYSNGAGGSFQSSISMASSLNGSATLNVRSNAAVSAGGLTMANLASPSTATLEIDGAGSVLTLTGGTASNIGAASASNAQILIDNGGVLNTNTGTFMVNNTGSVNLVEGSFFANGNMTLNGGQFQAGVSGNFNLAANRTLTVTNGGDASFADLFFLNQSNARVTISGSGATLTGNRLLALNGNTVTVSNAGSATFADILVGSGGPIGTTLVTGAGSSMTATATFEIGQGTHTFSSGATGSLGAVEIDAERSALSGVSGDLMVQSGATVISGTLRIASIGFSGGNANALTVTGAGSSYTQTGAATVSLGYTGLQGPTPSTGTLNVADAATFASGTGTIFLNTNGTINLDGGTVDLRGPLNRSGGVMNFNRGALKIIDPLTVGTGGLLGTSLTLDSTRSFTTTNTTTIDAFRTLTLNGGAFSTGALVNNGTLAFNSGTLAITGAGGFNIGTGALGSSITLGTGATLQVSQTTTINAGALLRLNGGVFTSANVTNTGTLDQQNGTLNITGTLNNAAGSRLFVGGLSFDTSNVTNAGRITLLNGLGEIGGTGTITNTGVITGDGTIGKAVTNSASGQLRAEAGKTLLLTGAVAANAGTYSLEGGTLEFTNAITNGATGTITGFGALRSALLTNQGNIGLSGDARFYGDVTNAAGARIITSGGSTTTFYDDVIHNGTEIRTSAGGSSVFFGAVSGAGPFTGTGTVYFEGDLRPGNSPALVRYGGDVALGGASTLALEIGGLLAGSEYDRLNVAGTLFEDGVLNVSLYGGFTPHFGDTFDLFDAGAVAGSFDAINLPNLGGDLEWDATNLQSTGQLRVVPEPSAPLLTLLGAALLSARRRKGKIMWGKNHWG